MYRIKEIFYSLQGEGFYSGRPAVFCRFSGCNLWSGQEEDRSGAPCPFCDTDFTGTDGTAGGLYETAADLACRMAGFWPGGGKQRFAVLTGGEPLLQVDEGLLAALHDADFEIAVETNGTIAAPAGIDWLCVSPKGGVRLAQKSGQELKLVYPQGEMDPALYASLDFRHFFLQPRDGRDREEALRRTLDYVLAHPPWRLSLQMHKWLGIR
ncbi:MAG: 7-carboxy-7-deazaguanine synthase [Deltaproteobacteria bacterium]|jgi:7-carboxy-7-deazaguanine synthase (Cx14CxxC type)